jgi:hypothetical protein
MATELIASSLNNLTVIVFLTDDGKKKFLLELQTVKSGNPEQSHRWNPGKRPPFRGRYCPFPVLWQVSNSKNHEKEGLIPKSGSNEPHLCVAEAFFHLKWH